MLYWWSLQLAWVSVAFGQQQRLHSSAFGLPGRNASYDYVVVGGGTAGLAIASRLAEKASVAVIEAGGYYEVENGNSSVVPLLSLTGMPFIDPTEGFARLPLIDWGLLTTKQSGNRRIHYAQGKTLGGSSAINTFAYIRGPAGAYQRWADLVGDDSYTFPNVLPYFKKSCHLTPPNLKKRNSPNVTVQYDPSAFDDSLGGPLQVSWNNWVDPTITWLAKSLQSIGIAINPKGFSSGILDGASWAPGTISPENAFRSTSQSSYLEQAIKNTQITVYTHSQGMKILFDSSKRATSVVVSTQGVSYTLSANKEVIVSTGVFHSPQLLMVSGIGPRSTLESFGIPVVADLPAVGQNMWDPISFNIRNYINTPSGQTLTSNPATQPVALQQYLKDGSGPYSSAAGYLSFEKVPQRLRQNFSQETRDALAALPSDWPEIEYIVGAYADANGTTVGSISATVLTSASRGNVTITSASMLDQPSINLGWFSSSVDGEIAVAGFKRLREAWSSDAAKSIRLGPEVSPGAGVATDADILKHIQNNANQIWHASATCRMGKNATAAVVDSKARVFGVSGLRVVDLSVFPFSIPGHPQASVYMLAEKIADDIKQGR